MGTEEESEEASVMTAMLLLVLAQDYQTIPLAAVATTRRTHICVVGPVVYVRRQQDGDIHITLDDGETKVVLEIIPSLPLGRPQKGQRIKACGITRYDRWHQWPEIHPVTDWVAISPTRKRPQ